MFGLGELAPYRIEHHGQVFYGNVSLRDFHVFEYDDALFLVNVESMAVYPISKEVENLLNRIAALSDGLILESEIRELRKFQLIAGDDDDLPGFSHAGEIDRSQSKHEYIIDNISLFLAQECNMRCVYCYGADGEYGLKGMMSEETAFRAVDWLIANSGSAETLRICFFGGEPLLNFSLMKKVVKYARQQSGQHGKTVAFSMTTNGSLLRNEVISFIKSQDIDPVISFDGPPEYQNRQRPFKGGRGSYNKVLANVRKLKAVRPYLRARATVYGDADPLRIKESADLAGFSSCMIEKASPAILKGLTREAPEDGSQERMSRRLIAYYHEETHKLLAAIRKRSIDIHCPPDLFLAMSSVALKRKRHHGCGVGKRMVGITIIGDIYPCHRFAGQEDQRIGNISDYRVDGANEYYRSTVDTLPECRKCWARYFCGGGCFYHNLAHTGDMHRPEALDCEERIAMYEGLIRVYCQLDEDEKLYVKRLLEGSYAQAETMSELSTSTLEQ